MKTLVAIIAALSLLAGVACFFTAKSAVHEILGAILILCFVVSVVGLAALDLLVAIKDELVALRPKPPSAPIAFPKSSPPIGHASLEDAVESMKAAQRASGR